MYRVFTDFNCPFCYALEERLAGLGVLEQVSWQGVEHDPALPVPMAPADAQLALALPAEVDAVARLAPDIAIARPPGKPATRTAIDLAAAALTVDRVKGRELVSALYRVFWTAGADLSDPATLSALAAEHGLPDLQADAAAVATAQEWTRQWQATGLNGVPLLVSDDGRFRYGLTDIEDLERFFGGAR